MAISRKIDPKRPSQNPNDFYHCKQQGGEHGKPSGVPEQIKSMPMREKMRKEGL